MANGTLEAIPTEVVVQITDIENWVRKAPTLTAQHYKMGCDYLKTLALMRREIQQHYARIKKPINAARKKILDLEKEDLARVVPAEARLRELVVAFEEDRKAHTEDTAKLYLIAAEQGTPLPDLPAPPEPISGQHRTTRRQAVVTDLSLLIKAVADGTVGPEVLRPNVPALNRMVRQRGDLFSVPGVRVDTTTTVVVR